ncbi:MAG: transporter, family, multidrug resistance protein [Betaproteobacteria bacterium]|nr:transporter, family, multidrug resistance protein [Betaproteobacteria bacterium]
MKNNDTPLGLTLLLGILVALSALGTDLYVPALPDAGASFSAPVRATQLTITTYFVGLALGQLFWGPLSDRYGRRPVLLTALSGMLVVSAAAPFAPSIAMLTLLRLAQGLAMSGGVVVARSVARDLHAHEQAARLLARMMIVFSIVPIGAPILGAALTSQYGWRAVFWALSAIAIGLLVAVAFGLRETVPAERRSARPAEIARTLASILAERRFISPLLLFLSCQAGILAWVASSSFTLVQAGVSIAAYGWMFAGVMLGQITGAWVASRFVMYLGSARLMRTGALLILCGGIAAGALSWGGASHWLSVVLPFTLLLFGSALVIPSATSMALSPFPHAAGAASSLIGAIGFTSGALLSALLGLTFDGTSHPMASVAAVAGVCAFVFERRLARGKA